MEEIISHIQNNLIRERLPIWLLSIMIGDGVQWIYVKSWGVFKVQLYMKAESQLKISWIRLW